MMKIAATLSTVIFSAAMAQAGLYINAGSSPTAGIGPDGADANYLTYSTVPENDETGAVQTYNGTSFAEGGLAGAYDVGVGFNWTTNGVAAANTVKQSFNRIGTQNPGYGNFWGNWVGLDSRSSQGGMGAGTTMTLTLTGLEANQDFTLTTYHFDPNDQLGEFTTSASGTTVYQNGKASGVSNLNTSAFVYDFDLTSDGSGTAMIDFVNVSGSWNSLNGFDLVAVPEPATLGMVAVFGGGIMFIRRRFMM